VVGSRANRKAARALNKYEAWEGRSDAFTKVSDHVATLIGAREGAAVIPLRG